ncbi:ABC-type metal ion transport system, ATPase component [Desulfosporosinus orientis DSM 765]|uniref:ABC-type metal ion transport system, ATPase component n=1 Tax=Desulfosporosinus orientis (strain ATCC 19365 / DSM 765 / NCIMB 8382 / VKM B-1628 / Singapore I) TaxID=768706 RepID=G7WGI5_DESOD|nr:methionine ABC transporter ATP-binding protein [Desulfosporosinus orientis]AET68062.1 ABC-type metal ion transport system, ATPase component [Desulfosporosinus orientis DSM 765]
MIEITNLQKSFGGIEVLKNINITIQDGEIYGLVGKSGAGKSTLLRCINGLETYSSGSIKTNGVELNSLDKKGLRNFRKEVAMIFQHFPLLGRKTVYDNISFPMKCWKYDKNAIDKRVRELAEIVGISDKLKQKPSTLSGGQKQRVAIARALSMNPKILLSDEATSALDPKTTTAILQLLREINEKLGITIVVVSHQMEVIRQVCQKVSLLENGHIVTSGKVDEVFLNVSKELHKFLGTEEMFPSIDGVNLQIMLLENDDSKQVLSRLARTLDVDFSILGGKVERYRDKHLGSLIINFQKEDISKVKEYLTDKQIVWHSFE